MKNFIIATLVALGIMFGGTDESFAFHTDFAHTNMACPTVEGILYAYTKLLQSDYSMREMAPFGCQNMRSKVTSEDLKKMKAVAAPAPDYEGD